MSSVISSIGGLSEQLRGSSAEASLGRLEAFSRRLRHLDQAFGGVVWAVKDHPRLVEHAIVAYEERVRRVAEWLLTAPIGPEREVLTLRELKAQAAHRDFIRTSPLI